MTVAETGQSNTIFALALELITNPNIDVHVASFPALRRRVEELLSSVRVVEQTHPNSSFTFHEIGGMSLGESIEAKGLSGTSFPHPPMARSSDEGIEKLIIMLTSWNGKGAICYFDLLCRRATCVSIANEICGCSNLVYSTCRFPRVC